jgi:hypothetical protein
MPTDQSARVASDTLVCAHVADDESGESFGLGELIRARGSMPPPRVHHRDDETVSLPVTRLTGLLSVANADCTRAVTLDESNGCF